jgi:transglycosylase-like protein with SLT domain
MWGRAARLVSPLLLTFVVLATFGPVGIVQPAAAASADRVDSVKAQLAAAADRASRLDQDLARLQSEIEGNQRQIATERLELRRLARVLYVQPTSFALLLAESHTLGEAITRWSDLSSAGHRAAALKQSLIDHERGLEQQRSQIRASRADLQGQIEQLNAQFRHLQAMAAEAAAAAQPAPPATTRPGRVPSDSIRAIIVAAFSPLGQNSVTWALRVAACESGYNPYAVNRSSGAAGLFQFMPSTWAHSPWAAQSPFDPVANSQAAAWLLARSGGGQWVCQ